MSHHQRRSDPRVRVTIRARMRDGTRSGAVCILDLSPRGLLATAPTPPRRGEFVEIVLGTTSLVGQVRWASQHRFGIALRERIDVGAIAKGDLLNFRARFPERQAAAPAPLAVVALQTARRAQRLNFCLAIAAVIGAAIFLADTVRDELGVLGKASQAMAGSRGGHKQ